MLGAFQSSVVRSATRLGFKFFATRNLTTNPKVLSPINVGAGESIFVKNDIERTVTMDALVYCNAIVLESNSNDGDMLGHSFIHYEGRNEDKIKENIEQNLPKDHSNFNLKYIVAGPTEFAPHKLVKGISPDRQPHALMCNLTRDLLEKLEPNLSKQSPEISPEDIPSSDKEKQGIMQKFANFVFNPLEKNVVFKVTKMSVKPTISKNRFADNVREQRENTKNATISK
ncbi:MAG: hypothetical protein K2P53_01550 [Rickettsiales bacterium]|nr:hypothetical protein [Rickettsiales bacterium]